MKFLAFASGETVGTGFAAILNRLGQFGAGATKPMQEAAEQLENFGLKLRFFDEQSQQFLGVDNMVRELEKLQALPQLERVNILQRIFAAGRMRNSSRNSSTGARRSCARWKAC